MQMKIIIRVCVGGFHGIARGMTKPTSLAGLVRVA